MFICIFDIKGTNKFALQVGGASVLDISNQPVIFGCSGTCILSLVQPEVWGLDAPVSSSVLFKTLPMFNVRTHPWLEQDLFDKKNKKLRFNLKIKPELHCFFFTMNKLENRPHERKMQMTWRHAYDKFIVFKQHGSGRVLVSWCSQQDLLSVSWAG